MEFIEPRLTYKYIQNKARKLERLEKITPQESEFYNTLGAIYFSMFSITKGEICLKFVKDFESLKNNKPKERNNKKIDGYIEKFKKLNLIKEAKTKGHINLIFEKSFLGEL